jgi:hypothetical protein
MAAASAAQQILEVEVEELEAQVRVVLAGQVS